MVGKALWETERAMFVAGNPPLLWQLVELLQQREP